MNNSPTIKSASSLTLGNCEKREAAMMMSLVTEGLQ